jgi:glycosyltransferase
VQRPRTHPTICQNPTTPKTITTTTITATHYRRNHVARLPHNSVAKQTYAHREHVMVDGASTDSTVDIINQHINQHTNQIATFITEPDKGIYDALNKGLKTLE